MSLKTYAPELSMSVNSKGVLDVDSVKGCGFGMSAYPNGGCYSLCYAATIAKFRGFDFSKPVSRNVNESKRGAIERRFKKFAATWFRIGVMGEPCHDWPLTIHLCEWLGKYKTPVIVTKHWEPIPEEHLKTLREKKVAVNTSISPLDTPSEIKTRLEQFQRLKNYGVNSSLRIVSAKFGNTTEGNRLQSVQENLFRHGPVIDNPLRIPSDNNRVKRGDIKTDKHFDLNRKTSVSLFNRRTYLGHCSGCKEQCGLNFLGV